MKTEKDIHIKEPPAGFNWLERDILYLNKLIKSQRSPKNLQKKLSSENWYFWKQKKSGEKLLLQDLYNTKTSFTIYSYELAIMRRISIIASQRKLKKRRLKDCREAFKIYPQKALLNEITLPFTEDIINTMGKPLKRFGNGYFHPQSKKTGNLKVILTEEHDASLYYWLKWAEQKKIEKSNIILHFDAHSDMSLIEEKKIEDILKIKNADNLKNFFSSFYKKKSSPHFTINITNYLHYAAKSGIAKEIFWVMPDPDFCKLRLAANLQKSFLLEIDGGENFTLEHGHIICRWEGIKIHILRLSDLPVFNQSIILDIDTDYFLNEDSASYNYGWHGYRVKNTRDINYWSNICTKPLKKGSIKPWISLEHFYNMLCKKNIRSGLCTVCLSPFYTPEEYHSLPEKLAEKLGYIIFDKP